ncbi:MAG: uroporphyrinogen decarboxylase family protein [bacterium]
MNKIEEVIYHQRRYAVFPMVGADHCAFLLKRDFKEITTNGEKLAEVLEYGYRLYGYDMILIFSDPYVEAEAMGCKIEYTPYPRLVSGSKNLNEYLKLSKFTPADFVKLLTSNQNRTKQIIRAAEILKKTVDVPVFVSIKGPFTLASFIYGIEKFLRLLLNDEIQTSLLIDIALNFQLAYLNSLLKTGVHIFIGDPMASTSIISPQAFKKFAQEPLRILIEKVKGAGLFAGIHICGDTKPIINLLDGLNADILSIEDISLETTTIKMGGLSTLTLLHGTPDEIKKEIKKAVSANWLILSSSCDVPVNTPMENIKLMIAAINE